MISGSDAGQGEELSQSCFEAVPDEGRYSYNQSHTSLSQVLPRSRKPLVPQDIYKIT